MELKAQSLMQKLSLEWLETNALGGYASSTVVNCHTRRYHGLLVSALQEPAGKFVLVSNVEETLIVGSQAYELTTTQYPNHLVVGGAPFLEAFEVQDHPIFFYSCGPVKLEKEILMLQEEDTVFINYTLKSEDPRTPPVQLKIRPFLAYRDFHALAKENAYWQEAVEIFPQGFQITPYATMPTLYVQTSHAMEFLLAPEWYRNFEYEKAKERGYDYHEDLFTPGMMVLNFHKTHTVTLSFSLKKQKKIPLLWRREITRRQKIPTHCFIDRLKKSAHQFLIHKAREKYSIIAGYHWFLAWGRDAMIALPGLTLYVGLKEECLLVLRYFAAYEQQGLIPNFIAENEQENAYDTVDASLWFVWAVQQYYLHTKDKKSIKNFLWDTLKNIIMHYQQGTRYGIHQAENGLIYAGVPSLKLTWMDAKVNGVPITPRNGAAVEVNALWYNALCFMHELAGLFKDPVGKKLAPVMAQVKANFQAVFWNDARSCLYDFVNDQEKNSAIRPNQIFALSLPYSPLSAPVATAVLNTVIEHLLTPYGLRTLAPCEKAYVGRYCGMMEERDAAYHNGTVWPWLLGHFTDALLKTGSDRNQVNAVLKPCITALEAHFASQVGLECISEIFDGDAPHHPHGCIQQAWSVAELIRVISELSIL